MQAQSRNIITIQKETSQRSPNKPHERLCTDICDTITKLWAIFDGPAGRRLFFVGANLFFLVYGIYASAEGLISRLS